ncbi:RNA 3'-terminal phosphate cyclase domain-containing protein [Xylariales sp. PMI_506]|nr:RNA 3'-terminal phosphate cyclase domain-containing protein [Xylariales sp. PMI_506]
MAPKLPKPIILDGRTGEGGGQLVRIACALAAVTTQPIRITHVRGNREGPRGGGLKSQHVTSLRYLAQVTDAIVDGLSVGSHELEFRPQLSPPALQERKIQIDAESSAASALLIFQAVFPYLLFAHGGDDGASTFIDLEIQGGTNVAFSLSWDYLDQVLLPVLEDRFGIRVERTLVARGWSTGHPLGKGIVRLRFQPLGPGQTLKLAEQEAAGGNSSDGEGSRAGDGKEGAEGPFKLAQIDATILAPWALHAPLQQALARDLDVLFPDVPVAFPTVEDSGHDARMYVLLVARSELTTTKKQQQKSAPRWGRDWLYDLSRKNKSPVQLAEQISRRVCKDLYGEVVLQRQNGTAVDEFMQDQLVVFQALAEGRTCFLRGDDSRRDGVEPEQQSLEDRDPRRLKKDKVDKPFGEGSTHTTTARWVTAELLPGVKWFNKGAICEGIGLSFN